MLSSSPSKIHEPLVTGVSPRASDSTRKLRNTSNPVGFHNSATASDQGFQAAGSYWLISPPYWPTPNPAQDWLGDRRFRARGTQLQGSVSPFVAWMSERGEVSRDELAELEALVSKLRTKTGGDA